MEVKDLPQITESTESDFAVSSISQNTRLISFKNIFEKISFSSLATKAKNIIGAINELNTDLEWKVLGVIQGKDQVLTLPSNFKELNINTWVVWNEVERAFNIRLLKDQLGDTGSAYTLGGYYVSTTDFGLSSITISKTEARIRYFYYASQDLSSTSNMKIRYR